jgi:hypothetical protein
MSTFISKPRRICHEVPMWKEREHAHGYFRSLQHFLAAYSGHCVGTLIWDIRCSIALVFCCLWTTAASHLCNLCIASDGTEGLLIHYISGIKIFSFAKDEKGSDSFCHHLQVNLELERRLPLPH